MFKFNPNNLAVILLAPLFILLLTQIQVLPNPIVFLLVSLGSLIIGGWATYIFLHAKTSRLLQLANTDTTTGLYNSEAINRLLNYDIERAKRYKRELSVILLDVDQFSSITELHGEQRAENILKFLSHIILQGIEYTHEEKKEFHGIRSSDIAFRYVGEDKILVVMPETGLKGAFVAAERIREAVMYTPFHHQNTEDFLRITLSAGVASFDADNDTTETLLGRVNLLLLKAKITTNEVVRENPIHHGLVAFGGANSTS